MDTQFTALQVPVAPSSGADFFLGALLMLRCRFFVLFFYCVYVFVPSHYIYRERVRVTVAKTTVEQFQYTK